MRAVRWLMGRLVVCATVGFALHVFISAWLAFGVTQASFEASSLGRERIAHEEANATGERERDARHVFTGRLWISGFFASRGLDIVTSHDNGPPVVEVVEYRAGWPWRSWRATAQRSTPNGTAWMIQGGLTTGRTIELTYGSLMGLGVPRSTRLAGVVPWQPVWGAMLANVGVMTGVIAMAWFVPWAGRRAIRAWRRQCPACAYPVGVSDRCSECGRPVRPATFSGVSGMRSEAVNSSDAGTTLNA